MHILIYFYTKYLNFLFPNVIWFALFVECSETFNSVFGSNELTVTIFFDAVASSQIHL